MSEHDKAKTARGDSVASLSGGSSSHHRHHDREIIEVVRNSQRSTYLQQQEELMQVYNSEQFALDSDESSGTDDRGNSKPKEEKQRAALNRTSLKELEPDVKQAGTATTSNRCVAVEESERSRVQESSSWKMAALSALQDEETGHGGVCHSEAAPNQVKPASVPGAICVTGDTHNRSDTLFTEAENSSASAPLQAVIQTTPEEETLVAAELVPADDDPLASHKTVVEAVPLVEFKRSTTLKWIAMVGVGGAVVALVIIIVMAVSMNTTKSPHEEHPLIKTKTGAALLLLGVQDCFAEASVSSTGKRGTLAVADSASLIPVINRAREHDCLVDFVVRSEDYHPRQHISFASTHGLPPFAHDPIKGLGKGLLPVTCINTPQSASCCPTYWVDGPDSQDCDAVLCPKEENMTSNTLQHVLASPACTLCQDNPQDCFPGEQAMWPDHCIQGEESGVPPTLFAPNTDIVLKRGDNDYVDGYSAFMDNTRNIRTPLDSILKSQNIHTVYMMGMTTDYGVRYAAGHSIHLGYNTVVVMDATRYIADDTYAAAIQQMEQEGVSLITLDQFLSLDCPS